MNNKRISTPEATQPEVVRDPGFSRVGAFGTVAGAAALVAGGLFIGTRIDGSDSDSNSVSADETTSSTLDGVSDGIDTSSVSDETVEQLRAAGMDEVMIAEIIGVVTLVEQSSDKCVAHVETAMSDDLTVETDDGTFIDRSRAISAGIIGGKISNGGVNQFTDSVGVDYKEGDTDTRQEVANYFAQGIENDAVRIEALEEAMARVCADPYQAASGAVMISNAELGTTGVKLGDIFTVLEEYVVDGERTEEKMDDMYALALDNFIGLADASNEEKIEAYDVQMKQAATMAAILGSLGNFINNGTITVQESTVAYGADENRVALRHSDDGIDGALGETLGGRYESQRGESFVFFWDSKAGCIVLNGLTVNMLDGRYGYTLLGSQPEGCEPIYTVVPGTPGEPHDPGDPTTTTSTLHPRADGPPPEAVIPPHPAAPTPGYEPGNAEDVINQQDSEEPGGLDPTEFGTEVPDSEQGGVAPGGGEESVISEPEEEIAEENPTYVPGSESNGTDEGTSNDANSDEAIVDEIQDDEANSGVVGMP